MKLATAFLIAVVISPPSTFAQGNDDPAQQILQHARAAAGEQKLAALQSLTVEGKSKRQMRMNRGGETQTMTRESEFTLDFLMPDKYLRRETTEVNAMGQSGYVTNISGFNGSALIQDMESTFEMPAGGPGMRMGQPDPAQMVRRSQIDAARNWLAWTLAAPAYAELQFRHAGVKDGADIIEVIGADMPPMQIAIDQQSRHITSMRFKAPAPRQMMMMGPGGPAPQNSAAPPEEVDVEIAYSDFKAVEGVMLPHRIRRSTNGEVTEETEIKKFKLNPNLKADRFKPRSPSNQAGA